MSTQVSPPRPLRKPNDQHVPWLLRRIWDRVNVKNEHFMGVIVGREGSGKSFTALKIANAIDPSFTADRVLFDVVELLEILKDGDHEPGHFYVLDEAGVQLGRRTWQDRAQVLANQALQLIRDHNLGLVFTLPRLGELDSQAQGRLQAFLELTEKQDGDYVRGKWKWMDPDRTDETGTIYKKFPRRRSNGRLVRVTSVAFTPPSDALVGDYEERKREFQTKFYEEVIEQFKGEVDDGEDEEELTVKEIAMEIADGSLSAFVSAHKQTGEPYINKELVRAEYGLPHSDARAVKALLERQFTQTELREHV